MHPARLPEIELRKSLRAENTRGSGPGGQHRNRVATAMRLTHIPTGIMGSASERRERKANERVAMQRLRLNLALQHRTPLVDENFVAPGAYEPSDEWERRRRGQKIRVNTEHVDFAAVLAEVLDRLLVDEDDLERTASAFRISKSQLVKFLALEPVALSQLNERRKARGKRPLRAP